MNRVWVKYFDTYTTHCQPRTLILSPRTLDSFAQSFNWARPLSFLQPSPVVSAQVTRCLSRWHAQGFSGTQALFVCFLSAILVFSGFNIGSEIFYQIGLLGCVVSPWGLLVFIVLLTDELMMLMFSQDLSFLFSQDLSFLFRFDVSFCIDFLMLVAKFLSNLLPSIC